MSHTEVWYTPLLVPLLFFLLFVSLAINPCFTKRYDLQWNCTVRHLSCIQPCHPLLSTVRPPLLGHSLLPLPPLWTLLPASAASGLVLASSLQEFPRTQLWQRSSSCLYQGGVLSPHPADGLQGRWTVISALTSVNKFELDTLVAALSIHFFVCGNWLLAT